MKKEYSRYALWLFVAGVVFKSLILLVADNIFFTIGFYLSFVIGLVLLGVETISKKDFANAFCFDNHFMLSGFSYLAGIGFFIDFVAGSFKIYNVSTKLIYNRAVHLVPLVGECAFALFSVVCMITVALSFSKKSNYDFRNLQLFNIVPLIWFAFKGVGLLADNVDIFSIDKLLAFVMVSFGIIAFYFFVRETENKKGASPIGVYTFRGFYYSAVMFFIVNLMLVLKGDLEVISYNFANSVSYFFIGVFTYFFEKNILAHSSADE